MRNRGRKRLNPLKWLGYLLTPIQKNGAFFVFMFALGWLCTESQFLPELFFDLYIVCALLMLVPQKIRLWVKALLYIVFYGVAIVDTFCLERFESTLTPTMLMLVSETTRQETAEFLKSYLSWDVITSRVGWILLLILVHLLWTFLRFFTKNIRKRLLLPKIHPALTTVCRAVLGLVVAWLLVDTGIQAWGNKVAMHRMFSLKTIGQVEWELHRKDKAEFYLPVYRLAFSYFANHVAADQVEELSATYQEVVVDSCSFRVPNIVLVIGESYNKYHSQLYGYDMPTTPRQKALAEEGSLVPFTDVVAPWNLTSFVFKNVFSLHAVGDSGEWSDKPLFPEVFRKAGYHVTFITNQFQSQAGEELFDFSGGFFLNSPELSKAQFDSRNTRLHQFDEGVLEEYDSLKQENTDHNLVILHLKGSHVMYKERYPQETRKHLLAPMYNRPELTPKQRLILADYDNSVLYNDSIVAVVTQKFIDQDALVIYMPDHGEEIFDDEPRVYGRRHQAAVDYTLAKNEMEIPFWIWGSPKYRENHPYGWKAIQAAKDRPMMTDVLPHLLLYLGGISTPFYREEYNVIMPAYNVNRKRILKGETDYNTLKKP